MSYSQSTGSSRGSSSSLPISVYSNQVAIATQMAQAAAALGEYQYQWAMDNYAGTSAMTDLSVQNYLQMSQYGLALAQNQLGRYVNMYEPEENTLAQLAGTYSSAAREAVNMGAAESATEQAGNQALAAATQNLQSYGIDPSSGMYGELQEAQRAATGAAAAGAGQQAELATQATGRQLLGESIAVGQQLPGDVVNDLNNAYEGVAGAENSVLANANTGVNLTASADPFLNTGMSLKYPPTGQQSVANNASVQGSNSSKPNQQKQSTGNGGYGTGGIKPVGAGVSSGGSGPSVANGIGAGLPQENTPMPGPALGLGPLSSSVVGGSTALPVQDQFYDPYSATNTGAVGNPGSSTESAAGQFYDPYSAEGAGVSGGGIMPPTSAGGASSGSFGGYIPQAGGVNPVSAAGAINTDVGGGASAPPSSGSDSYGGGYTPQAAPTPDENTSYGNSGGSYGGYAGGGYAQGGAIPAPRFGAFRSNAVAHHGGGRVPSAGPRIDLRAGGKVPVQASPSMGARVDDVKGNLNAHEFVIPQDVALWKGQEFFQKLINDARKNNAMAPAKPTQGPPGVASQQRPVPQQRPQPQTQRAA